MVRVYNEDSFVHSNNFLEKYGSSGCKLIYAMYTFKTIFHTLRDYVQQTWLFWPERLTIIIIIA